MFRRTNNQRDAVRMTEDNAKLQLVAWLTSALHNGSLFIDPTAMSATMSVRGSGIFIFGAHNDGTHVERLFMGVHHSMSDWFFDVPWVRVDIVPPEHRIHLIAEMKPGKYFTLVIHDENGLTECLERTVKVNHNARLCFRAFKLKENKPVSPDDTPYMISQEVLARMPLRIVARTARSASPEWLGKR